MSPDVSIFVRYSNETDIFGIPMHSEFFFEISASVPAHQILGCSYKTLESKRSSLIFDPKQQKSKSANMFVSVKVHLAFSSQPLSLISYPLPLDPVSLLPKKSPNTNPFTFAKLRYQRNLTYISHQLQEINSTLDSAKTADYQRFVYQLAWPQLQLAAQLSSTQPQLPAWAKVITVFVLCRVWCVSH